VLASPTTAAKIIRTAKVRVKAASAREAASDHLCRGMISPVAILTRNSASTGKNAPHDKRHQVTKIVSGRSYG